MPELHVADDDAGRRLDRVLRNGFPNVPPGAIAGAIRRGGVRLNGRRVHGDARVRAGDRIVIPDWTDTGRRENRGGARRDDRSRSGAGRDTRRHARRDDRGGVAAVIRDGEIHAGRWVLPILDRSGDWLVLNKPPGLTVHGKGAMDGIVRDIAAERGWWKESLSFRPGPVHRLDVDTSGVQVFSLSLDAARALTEELRHRRVTKLYLAVVGGTLRQSTDIDRRLGYDRQKRRAVLEPESGASAGLRLSSARTTVFPVISSADQALSLVAAVPHTGRTHQIRAHLSSIGLPLVGDETYGGIPWSAAVSRYPRLAERKRYLLHASFLAFRSPPQVWNAPLLPGDFFLVRTVFGDPAGLVQRLEQILDVACTGCDRDDKIRI